MKTSVSSLLFLLFVGLIVQNTNAFYKPPRVPHHFMNYEHHHYRQNLSNFTSKAKTANYKISYFNQPIDHFHYAIGAKSQKWAQKVLTDDTHWLGSEKLGPILFLTGCEESITNIQAGNGLFNDIIIPQVGAYAIFAEHRYFGDSLPFGNSSFEKSNLKYLTVEQALQDYAQIIKYYKNEVLKCPNCPVITYGGSYCGELAAWMRMRYPTLVDGAMASSAPIRYYDAAVDPDGFYAKSTQVFNQSMPGSADVIREGFKRLTRDSAESTQAYQEITKYMNFCSPMTSSKDVTTFMNWVSMAYQMGSMQNIPQYSGPNAGVHLIDISTRYFANLTIKSSDKDIYLALRASAMVNFGQNPANCLDIFHYGGTVGFSGWDVLTCTSMPVSMGPDGINDMYPPSPWNPEGKESYCQNQYGLKPQFHWVLENFGGSKLTDYAAYSNLLFVNGKNDPWMAGGVTQNITDSVVAYLVEDGCHVQDMYYASQYDSESLKFVRQKELEYIQKWINEKQASVHKGSRFRFKHHRLHHLRA